MIKANSGRAVVSIEGNNVTKTFYDELMFLKEKFAYMTFPELCAEGIVVNEVNKTIITKKGKVLRDWLKEEHTGEEKRIVKKKIIELLFKLHAIGYVHCDVHIDNVIIYPKYDVRLIDFEHLRCRSKEYFCDDIDVKGASHICAFDNSPRSIKTNLGDFE